MVIGKSFEASARSNPGSATAGALMAIIAVVVV
jgi:hypothetical protein